MARTAKVTRINKNNVFLQRVAGTEIVAEKPFDMAVSLNDMVEWTIESGGKVVVTKVLKGESRQGNIQRGLGRAK